VEDANVDVALSSEAVAKILAGKPRARWSTSRKSSSTSSP